MALINQSKSVYTDSAEAWQAAINELHKQVDRLSGWIQNHLTVYRKSRTAAIVLYNLSTGQIQFTQTHNTAYLQGHERLFTMAVLEWSYKDIEEMSKFLGDGLKDYLFSEGGSGSHLISSRRCVPGSIDWQLNHPTDLNTPNLCSQVKWHVKLLGLRNEGFYEVVDHLATRSDMNGYGFECLAEYLGQRFIDRYIDQERYLSIKSIIDERPVSWEKRFWDDYGIDRGFIK